LLHANADYSLAILDLHGLKGSRENVVDILQFMSGTLANTFTQRLTDVQSAAANGGYDNLSHRQQVTLRKFSAVLAVNLRQLETDGTGELRYGSSQRC
jgi:hypothetical protein